MSDDQAHRIVAELMERERALLHERERHARLQAEVDQLRTTLRSMSSGDEVSFGDLRRTSPVSDVWGIDRGLPVDRHYIAAFLDRHRNDICGRVLEVKDAGYTHMFGDGRVNRVDVLDIDAANPRANLIADLARADNIPSDTYDCVILTQVLGLIPDPAAALAHVQRILKPGGVLLCTVPASGRLSNEAPGPMGDYWRFTNASVSMLFERSFPPAFFSVDGYGNVLAASAFLYGLAHRELTRDELDAVDPFFPVVYAVRARKPERPSAAVLMYHRIADAIVDPHHLCVSPRNFRSHLAALRSAGIRVVPLSTLVAAAVDGCVPPRSVALTFDDGYRDALTTAAPILKEFDVPATFFVIGRMLEGDRFPWAEGVDALSGQEVRELAALPGVEIGAHSESHVRLTEATPAHRAAELDGCRERLQSILGVAVRGFAYPFGAVDAAVEAAVATSGYTYAVTTEARPVNRTSQRLRLPRLEAPNDDGAALLKLLARYGVGE